MSLPDTVFIFVLALIIFGPKKLPEIGRQIGRLVGEFRRASNEFKFQIEEELRQVERADQPNEKEQNRIEAPKNTEGDFSSAGPAAADPVSVGETMPIGQHPNIDSVNAENLESQRNGAGQGVFSSSPMPVSLATLTAAVGSLPRSTLPYVEVEPVATPQPTPDTESGSTAPTKAEITHD